MRGRARFVWIAAAAAAALSAAPSSKPSRPALFKDSRQSLAIARAQGRRSVALLIAAKPGAAASIAAEAKRLGGDVRYRDDEVGYLRVKIAPERANELAESPRIQAVTLDYDDGYPNRLGPGRDVLPSPPAEKAPDSDWPPRLSEYPLAHPYSPLHDLAADELLAKHPTFDGRGVTIAVLDGNFDMLLPEFQMAYALDGTRVPKIADYLNVTDPRDDADLNPQWVDMKATATASGGRIEFGGKTFRVARDGTYRVGFFDERRFNMDSNASYIDQDIDRDGNPKGDDGKFGVLWDTKSNDVWVDTNRNLDFTDEKALTDYARRPEFGVFGKDDPATPYRDTIGFAVQTDAKNAAVSINVGVYQHCTTILGSVVGNKEPNGRLQGVAPGARVVSMFYGVSNAHGLIEGLIAAFRHPQVDLIVLEQSVAIASVPYLLADGTHPISVIAQRLIDRYKKLLFVPGDNSPAFAFVAEDGLAPGAVSVGGYQSRESYRVNNGLVPEREDNLHWGALSHGPSGAGALKPDLLAPSGQMGTEVGYRKGAGQKGLYQLPPGYSVDGGTSTATPMAAGATALVVSAAKQSGVPYDAARLKAAISGSARHIEALAAHEQGNGLIQVGPAFELLRALKDAPPVVIESRAPVRTKLAGLLATPNEGVGIFEREGWKVGDRGERTITLTRKSGPSGALECSLSWLGNDGTFASPSSVTLPLGTPVAVAVQVTAKSEGAHTATLTVDAPGVPGHAHRILNAIVVPYRFTAENKYEVSAEVTPAVPVDAPVFVDVPPGVDALSFSASSPDVFLSLIGPDRDAAYPCAFDLHGQPNSCALASPQAGVWEINVCNNKAARNFDPEAPMPAKAAPVKVTASIVGVRIEATAAAGFGNPGPVSLENRFARVPSASALAVLASVRHAKASIAAGGQNLTELVVPKGATSLAVRLGNVSDPTADLDLYLLDCTEPEKPKDDGSAGEKEKGNKSPMAPPAPCAPAAKAADVSPEGVVRVENPKAGRWVIAVDAFRAEHGPVSYELVDSYAHPSLGIAAVLDPPGDRAPAGRWTAQAAAWSPESGASASRRLEAQIVAVSSDVTAYTGQYGQGERRPIPLGWADLPLSGAPAAAGGGR